MQGSERAGSAAAERARPRVLPAVPLLALSLVASGCVGQFAPPPTPADCRPMTSRICFCGSGESGVQTCADDGMYYSECRCSCTPGAVEQCSCASGEAGLRDCHASGEFWQPCQCQLDEYPDPIDDPRCATGEDYCPGVGCINLANSAENCGMCSRVCEGCDRCLRGACTEVCCAAETNCGDDWNPICADLESDPRNCGTCGVRCADRETCLRGGCVLQG